jgi:hypothetical protein
MMTEPTTVPGFNWEPSDKANQLLEEAGEPRYRFAKLDDTGNLCCLIHLGQVLDAVTGEPKAGHTVMRRHLTEEDVEEMTKRFLESRRQDSQAAKVVVNWEVLAHELGRAVVNAERGIKLVMETKDKPQENASLLQALHEVLVVGKQFYTKANGNP